MQPQSTMPKALKAKWLEDLRSGKYKQTRHGALKASIAGELEETGYCCLGVLQISAGYQDVERKKDGTPLTLPSLSWLDYHRCQFRGRSSESGWAGENRVPWLSSINLYATEANDTRGLSFQQIADAIETDIEGI